MTGEETGDGVEATVLPAPSLRGHVLRSGEVGIIGRDGREFCLRGEWGIRPRGSGSRRPPTMDGRPHAGAWRTGPQPHTPLPQGRGPLGKFGFPGMMGADDGWAAPRRDVTNLTPPPRTLPPLGGDP